MEPVAENSDTHLRIKTQLCRRFMQGTCSLGPNCNYAHGFNDLRTPTSKLCRMFMQNRHCSYGNNCRFLHGNPPLHHHHHQQQQRENINFSSPQPQPGKMQNAECRIMQTSAAAAATDGHSSAQKNIIQLQTSSSTPATNTSAITVATTSLHKNGPYADKSTSDKNTMQRVSRIYADWI